MSNQGKNSKLKVKTQEFDVSLLLTSTLLSNTVIEYTTSYYVPNRLPKNKPGLVPRFDCSPVLAYSTTYSMVANECGVILVLHITLIRVNTLTIMERK